MSGVFERGKPRKRYVLRSILCNRVQCKFNDLNRIACRLRAAFQLDLERSSRLVPVKQHRDMSRAVRTSPRDTAPPDPAARYGSAGIADYPTAGAGGSEDSQCRQAIHASDVDFSRG